MSFMKHVLALIKGFAHWCSGRSLLYRLCHERKLWQRQKGARLVRLIALHLQFSQSLKSEAKIIFNSPSQVDVDLDRLAKIITLRKGISLESEAFGVLKAALVKIFALERLIGTVIKRAKVPFKLEIDKALLEKLWTNLHEPSGTAQPTAPNIPPRIPDKQWKELGFQGDDPSTDFRGMGMLGLDHLVAFSSKAPKSAHNIWQQSNFGAAWYSFAPVGINITALLYGFLISRALDELLFEMGADDQTLTHLYQIVFEHFNEYWVLEEARDVMDFSRIFGKLRSDMKNNLENHGLLFQE